MEFLCNYCPTGPFPHFRALLGHYWEHHAEFRKRYEVKLKNGKSVALVYAINEDGASYATGWDRNDCTIKEIKEEE